MSGKQVNDSNKRGKKRSKAYYKKCAAAGTKRRKQNVLEPGIRGFLVTCNSQEKDAVRETYNILNEFAEKLYGPEELPKKNEGEQNDEGGNTDSEEDIETALRKEVESIKATTSSSDRRFQNINTKANNCIFIRTTLENPNELAYAVFTELLTTKIQRSRYAIRLLPVSITCRANMADIENSCKKLFVKDFETPFGTGLGFSIIFKMRNNTGINRGDVQEQLGSIIKEMNPLHYVNFTSPDIVISVDIIGSVCCLAIVKDFFKFRKFNMQEVVREIHRKEEIPDGGVESNLNEVEDELSKQEEENPKDSPSDTKINRNISGDDANIEADISTSKSDCNAVSHADLPKNNVKDSAAI